MSYILPDSVLEHQICSICKKYLSHPPIKVYQNGDIKCGRCSHSDDGGAISKLETVAENMLFPCINRFEGCTEITHFMDVEEHEKCCVGTALKCPICKEEKISLLFLIHHFKLDHFESILKNCVVDINLASEFDKYFMHYDFKMNKIFVVNLTWNKIGLSVAGATVINKKNTSEVPKFRFSFFASEETEKNLYKTDCAECLDLTDPIWNEKQEIVSIVVPPYLTNIRCKFAFHCTTSLLKKIGQFSSNNFIKFEKNSRKLYLAGNSYTYNKYRLSNCGKQLFFSSDLSSYTIACSFCENYFTSPDIYYDRNQSCYICRTCYSYGVTKSLLYRTTLEKLVDRRYSLLTFYCKFGCKKFFQSKDLSCHEDQCILNKKRSLSEKEYVKVSFGNEFIESSKFSRENVMVYEPNKFKGKGKIFIATRDNFKCIIDYEQDEQSKLCLFHINHKYDPNKYYILVHKWENNKFEIAYNDFSMCEKCDGASLFAINIKQI